MAVRNRRLPYVRPASWAAAGVYALFVLACLAQAPGLITQDTRVELTSRPGGFLAGAFSLWDPSVDFGQFQNQAYGYLFPQGPFFVLGHWLEVAPWITQRLWSALVLVIACEGARRVGRALGLGEAGALLAGLAFACSPRLLGTVGVISAESLPGAVMPWVLLPILAVMARRSGHCRAAVLSAAAVICMGGVNAVEVGACLVLPLAFLLWGWRSRELRGGFVLWWLGAVAVATMWWTLPLLLLQRFGPPFYEYVESAVNTTSLIGWSQAIRGDSNWQAYLASVGHPTWPAAYFLATHASMIVVAALVAGIGLAGLVTIDARHRVPLLVSACAGLGILTVGQGGWDGHLFSGTLLGLLDGPLQIFRNVHKFDPDVRLPIALGFASLTVTGVARAVRWRPSLGPHRVALMVLPAALVLSLGAPYELNQVRTPGWEHLPRAWSQARDYLVAHQGRLNTLVVPGSGFADQTWGWTEDEPFLALGGVHFVTRSQVPLIPGESIRFLTALDALVSSGRATPALPTQLARAGIGYVLVRRDLDSAVTGSPPPARSDVSALAGGLIPVARFGSAGDLGSALEIYRVPATQPIVRVTDAASVVRFRGGPEAVLDLRQAGLLGAGAAVQTTGDASVVTDTPQRRENVFGSVGAVSALMGPTDPFRLRRAVHDYPAGDVGPPVAASYVGLDSLLASSSQGYADTLGEVVPSAGPYAAADGLISTRWLSDPVSRPVGQWLRWQFRAPRAVHQVSVTPVVGDPALATITALEVTAGSQHRRVQVDPQNRTVRIDLDGSAVRSVQVTIVGAHSASADAPVGVAEMSVDGLSPTRSLMVAGGLGAATGFSLASAPGTAGCVAGATGADCDVLRVRGPEEAGGIDRTLHVSTAHRVQLSGWVVARDAPASNRLIRPLGNRVVVTGSSTYAADPLVAPRFAYDGDAHTEWMSADTDFAPQLKIHWARPHRVTGIRITAGNDVTEAPAAMSVTGGGRTQAISLDGSIGTPFQAVTARSLTLTFTKSPLATRVAIGEVALAGTPLRTPFAPSAPTGAPCGFGPNIEVGGTVVPTRVVGTMGEVVRGTPMRLLACSAQHPTTVPDTELPAGNVVIRTPPADDFFVTGLAGAAVGAAPSAHPSRTAQVSGWSATDRRLTVTGGSAALLWLPQNFNQGWHASYAGHQLRPVRVDGWEQGWRLPAGRAGAVHLWFGPQRSFVVVLSIGLLLAGLMLVAAIVFLARRPRADGSWSVVSEVRSGTRGRFAAPALVSTLLVTLFLLGIPSAVAAAWVLWRRRRVSLSPAVGVIAVLVALSGVVDVWLGPGQHLLATLAASVGVGVLIGVVAGPRPVSRGAHR